MSGSRDNDGMEDEQMKIIVVLILIISLLAGTGKEQKSRTKNTQGIGTPAYHEPVCGIGEAAYHAPCNDGIHGVREGGC